MPSTGVAAACLGVLVVVGGGWVAGIGMVALGDLSHSLLIITGREAVMMTLGPTRLLRRARVLEFARIRGMVVQEVRHTKNFSTEFTTHRLAVRQVHGRQETWDIGCAEPTYREIVAHFEQMHLNDADGLSTVTYVRMMDD